MVLDKKWNCSMAASWILLDLICHLPRRQSLPSRCALPAWAAGSFVECLSLPGITIASHRCDFGQGCHQACVKAQKSLLGFGNLLLVLIKLNCTDITDIRSIRTLFRKIIIISNKCTDLKAEMWCFTRVTDLDLLTYCCNTKGQIQTC